MEVVEGASRTPDGVRSGERTAEPLPEEEIEGRVGENDRMCIVTRESAIAG